MQLTGNLSRPRAPSPRDEILRLLKTRGALCATEIAEELRIGNSAVRPHLDALTSDGLVSVDLVRGGMGRPRHRYALTSDGHETFARAYDEIAKSMVAGVMEFGGEELLQRIFRRRERELTDRYLDRVRGLQFDARMRELASILDECGYMVTLTPLDDGYLITEHNCPVAQVALETHAACEAEHRFIQALAEADVDQIEVSRGGSHCQYVIRPARRAATIVS